MIKHATLYRLPAGALNSLRTPEPFVPTGSTQMLSFGWVPPSSDSPELVRYVGSDVMLMLQTEQRSVPAEVVKRRVDVLARRVEDATGRKPSKARRRELKEEALLELLPRAFPRRSTVPVWIDGLTGLLVVGSSSSTKVDLALTAVAGVLEGVSITMVQTAAAPGTAMTEWLMGGEAGEGFTLGSAAALKQTDESKATVRYGNLAVDRPDVRAHIMTGLRPVALGLEWRGHVAFTLTDHGVLKGIEMLDAPMADHDGSYEADVMIMVGEMRPLLTDLLAALGGEVLP